MKEIPESFIQFAVEQCKILQRIPSPTFAEQEKARYMMEQFERLGGSETVIDPQGNVMTKITGIQSSRPIVISAHLDTVHSLDTPLTCEDQEDRLVGPSIGDNSLGLAGLLTLLHYFTELKIPPAQDIWLVANTCEEGLGNLAGMKTIVNYFHQKPSAYLILEGIGQGNITIRGLSIKRYRIRISCEGGHSWGDFGQPSAIHELIHTMEAVLTLPLPQECKTTINVGKINGGQSINSLAPWAECELDVRSEQTQVLQQFTKQIESTLLRHQTDQVKVSFETIGDRPGGAIAETHPLVQKALQAYQAFEITPKLTSGSTDANIPLSLRYPAICIGLTEGAHSHSLQETIRISPLRKGFSVLIFLLNLLWMKTPKSRRPPGRKRR